MRRSLPSFPARLAVLLAAALAGALALLLIAPAPATADRAVVGGHRVPTAEAPWVVALASRELFGAKRSGQYCGGVAVAPTRVITAAHCLSRAVLGKKWQDVRDLRVIVGRNDLQGTRGVEMAPTK